MIENADKAPSRSGGARKTENPIADLAQTITQLEECDPTRSPALMTPEEIAAARRTPVRVHHDGKDLTLSYSEGNRAFALYDEDGEIYDRLDPPGCHERPAEHNACWIDEMYLDLLVDARIVEDTGEVRDFEDTAGHLVRIVHPAFHDGGYSSFGDFSRSRLGQQCQYGSRYIQGKLDGYPALGDGLRFENLDRSDYHSIRIHRDDMDEFERRYRAHNDARLARV